MALKAVLPEEEFKKQHEVIQREYVPKDGKYVLNAEGLIPDTEVNELKTKLAEFRDNNRTLHTRVQEFDAFKEKFKDVDPDEYRKIKPEFDKMKSKGVEKSDDVAKLVEEQLKPIKEKLAAEEKKAQEAQQRFIDSEFDKQITEVATKSGVRPEAVGLILNQARTKFEMKDGQIVARQGVKHPTEPHKDFTLQDWVREDLAKTHGYIFAPSEGSGAGGSRKRDSAGKVLVNPTAEEMGRYSKEIAKGEVRVERT